MWWTGGTLRCQNVPWRYPPSHLLGCEDRAWSTTNGMATRPVSFSSVYFLCFHLALWGKYRWCWALLLSGFPTPPSALPCVSLSSFMCAWNPSPGTSPFESGTRIRREFVASHSGPRSKFLFLFLCPLTYPDTGFSQPQWFRHTAEEPRYFHLPGKVS